MKIAVPTRGTEIDEHFGHCEAFTIFSVDETNKITKSELLASPAGCGCKSNIIPQLLEKGVSIILTGNIGQGAVNMLSTNGIEVCRGCSGNAREVLEGFLDGNIIDSEGICQQHGHGQEGGCGNHHEHDHGHGHQCGH